MDENTAVPTIGDFHVLLGTRTGLEQAKESMARLFGPTAAGKSAATVLDGRIAEVNQRMTAMTDDLMCQSGAISFLEDANYPFPQEALEALHYQV